MKSVLKNKQKSVFKLFSSSNHTNRSTIIMLLSLPDREVNKIPIR
jgi:hypothetical protein